MRSTRGTLSTNRAVDHNVLSLQAVAPNRVFAEGQFFASESGSPHADAHTCRSLPLFAGVDKLHDGSFRAVHNACSLFGKRVLQRLRLGRRRSRWDFCDV